MAQAPGGASGAPRQNKTIKDFKGMNTQNSRNAIPEGTFAWLENIQPIGPAHLHSIPGRGTSVTHIPPIIPPDACTNTTERGQQPIFIEDRFDQFNSFPPNTNLRSSWGYISDSEEVWTVIGEAGCGGGNMNYNDVPPFDCMRTNHFQSPVILTHPPLIDPNGLLPGTGVSMGVSDVPIWVIKQGNDLNAYYPNSSTHIVHTLLVTAENLIWQSPENLFAQIGNRIYSVCHSQNSPFNKFIVGFDANVPGNQIETYPIGEVFDVSMIACTEDFLYVLGFPSATPNKQQLRRYDRPGASLDATFMLDTLSPLAFGVVNDDLIYVFTAGSPAALYYISNFTTLTYIGNTVGQGVTPFGMVTGMFVNGAFYYGGNGFSGFTTDIFKVTVACPEGTPPAPVIASVSRGSNSVAAGANIVVSWDDVLLPVANDHIWLLPAPTPPDLGILFPPLVSRITDGLGTSSMNFLIPMGTTPGDYILAFMANDLIFVAKTATFTVT